MKHPHHYFLFFVIFLLCVITTTAVLLNPKENPYALAQATVIYYVDNVSGLDTNPGTNTAPFKTVAKGAAMANPGDTVRIKATTVPYEESIFPPKSGTPSARITYEGWNGKPRFITLNPTPSTVEAKRCVYIAKKDYITIRNIICDGQGKDPVLLPGSSAPITSAMWLYTGFLSFVQIYGGNYNIIENSEFVGALIGYNANRHGNGISIGGDGSVSPALYATYNKILNNKIVTTGFNAWHTVGISTHSNRNLVEGNEIMQTAGEPGSTHQAVQVLSSYNIVRNNRITNGSWTGVSFEQNAGDPSDLGMQNIFEGNRVFDTADTHNAMQIANQRAIIRGNFFYRNTDLAMGFYRSSTLVEGRYLNQNHVYQNTIYKNYSHPDPVSASYHSVFSYSVSCNVPTVGNINDNVLKNNILFNNGTLDSVQVKVYLGCDMPSGQTLTSSSLPIYGLDGFTIANNIILSGLGGEGKPNIFIWSPSVSYVSVSQAQSMYSPLVRGNKEVDPKFTAPDAGTPDFSLQSGSPAIDAGDFLTKAYPAGTAMIRFDDPYYFTDGYGLVPGDQIKFKTSGAVRRIQVLDYPSKTAIIDSAISLPAGGDDVALLYNGSAPDIGAVESSYSAPVVDTPPAIAISATPSTLSVGNSSTFSATASDDKAVAGVQFRVNGVNQGSEDTTSPYQLTYSPLVAGTYTITAVARDSAGQTTVSSPITVSVSAPVTSTLQSLIFITGIDTGRNLFGKSMTVSFLPPGSTNQTTPLESQTITASGPSQVSLSTTSRTPGSYDVRIKGPTTLSRKQTFTLSSNSTFTFTQKLISGDLNNDNSINSLDWSLMNTDWFQTGKTSDLNGDNITNALDFTWLNRNWFMRGE